ncbi:benzoate membrane transport protein [Bradyrhizobium algeriense]|uniref:Benzoate membrane transport protein n=1 Tax=Bradyrhizobium algeriense TaxID=634784 RepID=A0ABU8B5V0_9BRAD
MTDTKAIEVRVSPVGKAEDGRWSIFERAPGLLNGLRSLSGDLTIGTIGQGLVAGIFGTAVSLVILNGATKAGLGPTEATSWIFGVYFIGGLVTILVALIYRQPISFSWSIPGTALVVAALKDYSFAQLIGAYLIVAALVTTIALTGVVGRIVKYLPFPIVVAMIGGILLQFAIGVVGASQAQPVIVGAAIIGYFLTAKVLKKVPGVLGALVFGAAAAFLAGKLNFGSIELHLVMPTATAPGWSSSVILSVAVPLALLIICAENTKGVGILLSAGYVPPTNSMLFASGIGTLFSGMFGGHNLNVAGPMTAICSSPQAGNIGTRYAASVVQGVIYVAFGLVASMAVSTVRALPSELVGAVAGLAMITPLVVALNAAFAARKFQVGALVSLVVASTSLTIFGIGAPLWALAIGTLASWIVEPDSFRAET